jgi:hypothetical protein
MIDGKTHGAVAQPLHQNVLAASVSFIVKLLLCKNSEHTENDMKRGCEVSKSYKQMTIEFKNFQCTL